MRYSLGLLFLLISTLVWGQSTSIKALEKQAKQSSLDDGKRLNAMNQLVEIFYNKDIKKATAYCKQALKLAKKDSTSLGMCQVYLNQSLLSFNAGRYEDALAQAIGAVNLSKKLNRPTILATAYTQLSLIYSTKGYAHKAIEYSIEAVKIAENLGNVNSLVKGYYFLGRAYYNLDDIPKAQWYYNKVLTAVNSTKDKTLAAFVYVDMGLVYLRNELWEEAEQSIFAGMELSKKLSVNRGLAYGNYALGKLNYRQQYNDKAVEYFNLSLEAYEQINDAIGKASALEGLAKVAIERHQYKEGEGHLKAALAFARQSRATNLSKVLYMDLSDLYASSGDFKQSMRYYRMYNVVKDSIFNKDRNREIAEIEIKHNAQVLAREKEELTEKMRAQQLEMDLRSERLRIQQLRNNQNSYIIIGLISGLVLMVIIGLLVFRQDKLKTQIRETELEQRALRSQMNPHFMFNSLNSIQSLIATDNNAEASIYLAKFSRLMRRILQNSREAYIPLRQEIEFLDNYIELEQRRFKEAFDCIIDEEAIEDAHFVMIPPLVIQPFIENAIIHGLLRKSEKGTLTIRFEDYNNNLIKCTVIDNGIGREAAAAFKTDQSQESLGIKITEQRLKYLTLKDKISEPFIRVLDLKDVDGKATGTQVELLLPIRYKT